MSDIKETTLAVDGMTCSSCVRHVSGALRALEGVDAVDVALGKAAFASVMTRRAYPSTR